MHSLRLYHQYDEAKTICTVCYRRRYKSDLETTARKSKTEPIPGVSREHRFFFNKTYRKTTPGHQLCDMLWHSGRIGSATALFGCTCIHLNPYILEWKISHIWNEVNISAVKQSLKFYQYNLIYSSPFLFLKTRDLVFHLRENFDMRYTRKKQPRANRTTWTR